MPSPLCDSCQQHPAEYRLTFADHTFDVCASCVLVPRTEPHTIEFTGIDVDEEVELLDSVRTDLVIRIPQFLAEEMTPDLLQVCMNALRVKAGDQLYADTILGIMQSISEWNVALREREPF